MRDCTMSNFEHYEYILNDKLEILEEARAKLAYLEAEYEQLVRTFNDDIKK